MKQLVDKLIRLIKDWDNWESMHLDGLEEQRVKTCRLQLEAIIKEAQGKLLEAPKDTVYEVAHGILRLCESRWHRRESEPILPDEIAGMLDDLISPFIQLQKYTRHCDGCAYTPADKNGPATPCTCGLGQVIERIGEKI